MTKEELYLKTVFCCVACDGYIAKEEIDMIKDLCAKKHLFTNIEPEKYLNSWIMEINEKRGNFLQSYLKEINSIELNENEQLLLISLAINAIEADNRIEYAEIKFFKKIRSRLTICDDAILKEHPDKKQFLLPDINSAEIPQLDNSTHFSQISISDHTN